MKTQTNVPLAVVVQEVSDMFGKVDAWVASLPPESRETAVNQELDAALAAVIELVPVGDMRFDPMMGLIRVTKELSQQAIKRHMKAK
jgi:hypothetical protein